MILIISRRSHEITTELVIDWIEALGGEWLRLDAEDIWPGRRFSQRLSPAGEEGIELFDPEVDSVPIGVADVRVVWYRRWAVQAQYLATFDAADALGGAGLVSAQAFASLRAELRAAGRALMGAFSDARWLSDPESTDIDKIHALRTAARVGFGVPDTLVTTDRGAVEAFLGENPTGVITKTIGATPLSVDFSDGGMATYTTAVDTASLARWPETFAPSLFQSLVPKAYEVRVFVLGDDVYPMAIFSQDHALTRLDFRNYQNDRPNRYVPLALDDADRVRVLDLMRALDLDTGSLDLVCTPEGRLVFLEVNPVGQFGMVSYPCNYGLERKVAEYLVAADAA